MLSLGRHRPHLEGAKPVDMPVLQSIRFEPFVNGRTARMLGLTLPPSLLAIAGRL